MRAISKAIKNTIGGCTPVGLCLAVYFFSTGFDFLSIAPGVSLARLTGVFLLVIALFNAEKLRLSRSVATASLFALLDCSFVPLLFMGNPSAGLLPMFSFALSVLIAFLALSLPFTEEDLRVCELSLALLGFVMCLLLFLSPGNVGKTFVTDRVVVNIAGSQQDPNEFCGYFIFTLAFLGYHAVKRGHWWNLAFVGVILYDVLLTGSRGGLIACAVSLFAAISIGFKQTHRKMRWVVLLAAVLLVLLVNLDAVLASLPPSVSERFLSADFSGGTASFRTRAWSDVLDAYASSDFLLQLFGHGYGATTEVTFNGLVAHNSLVEVLYTFGFAGLIAYLVTIVLAVRSALARGKAAYVAAILGFFALLMTLSAYSFKAFWAILALSFMAAKIGSKGESKEAHQ